MKKKFIVSSKDKKDWDSFIKNINNISVKDLDIYQEKTVSHKMQKLDLHGFSLMEANKAVKGFIEKCFDKNLRKLLIVTGKGSRSKSYNNPYISEKYSVLKHAIPEFIKKDENLNKKIKKITKAEKKDGGEGALYIFLKKNFF